MKSKKTKPETKIQREHQKVIQLLLTYSLGMTGEELDEWASWEEK